MADPITWYLLPRRVDDPTTIEEMINQKILEHNQDPSAHGQSDEAIYLHRISSILDHVNYSIYNIKLHPISRPIKAFVDAGGAAEFTDIQSAIAYVSQLGGGKIFLYAGTYTLKNDLYLDSNIILEGEDDDLVVINMNGNKKIILEGTSSNYKNNVEIKNITFENFTTSASNAFYFKYVGDVKITNCIFRYKDDDYPLFSFNFFYLEKGRNILFENNYVYNISTFLYALYSDFCQIKNNFFGMTKYDIIKLKYCSSFDISSNYFGVNDALAFNLIEDCFNIFITNNLFLDENGAIVYCNYSSNIIIANNLNVYANLRDYSIYINDSNDVLVLGNILQAYNEAAIFVGYCYRLQIVNNLIYNSNDVGIGVYNSSSYQITIANNTLEFMYRTGILVKGSNLKINGNIVKMYSGSEKGVVIRDAQRVIFSDNQVYSAGQDGVYLRNTEHVIINDNIINNNGWYGVSLVDNTVRRTMVFTNIIRSNGSGAIYDQGLYTLKDHNMV